MQVNSTVPVDYVAWNRGQQEYREGNKVEVVFFFLGIPSGILASIIAWWILFRKLTPKMSFSDSVVKTPSAHSKNGYSYGVNVENSGSRIIVDAEFFVQFRAKGLIAETPNRWIVVFIPLPYNRIPRMRPVKTNHVRDILTLSINTATDFEKDLFPDEIRHKYKEERLTLEDIMGLGSDTTLQIISFGYDEFSGARKVFESKVYRTLDIVCGVFEASSLKAIPRSNATDFDSSPSAA